MKKQRKPSIKAQIIRSTFILLSLVAICAIPFSLAQRNAAKRSTQLQKLPGSAPAPDAVSGWFLVAPYPLTIDSPAVTSDGTYAYSAGGFLRGASLATAAFYSYDQVANTWTQLADMPMALTGAHAAYAAVNNSVYVFGGYLGNPGSQLNTTFRYNIATNTWTQVANMPAARVWPNVAYYSGNGKIYVIGGADQFFNDQGQVWEYDPMTDTWNTTRLSDPVPQAGANACISGQFIYLAGGGGGGSSAHERYDIVNNTWSAMASLPASNFQAGSANVGGQNYIFGGTSDDASSSYIYDIGSDTWSTGPSLNAHHASTGGTAIGNRLLVVAGFYGGSDNNTVEMGATVGCPPGDYTIDAGSGSYALGTTDTGNHCIDCTTTVALPFPVLFYDLSFNSINVSSKGNLQFTSSDTNIEQCLPYNNTINLIAPYWYDLSDWDAANGQGIFTSVSGTAPNRIFNVEYRMQVMGTGGMPALDFEVRLHENTPSFEIVYISLCCGYAGNFATVGVQRDIGSHFTQSQCANPNGFLFDSVFTYHPGCPSPTPTPTPTPACAGLCSPGPWTLQANYPFSCENQSVATDGTFVYSAGGIDSSFSHHSDLLRYDPVANTWTALANMPTPVANARATYAANVNKVYVFGGPDGNDTYVYDVASNTWTTGANMPDIRQFPEAVYYPGNGKIYVIGGLGFSSANENSQVWEYDPVADTWNTSRTAAPVAEAFSNTALSGQYIYLMGGYNRNAGSTNHYRYDIVGDTWTAMAPVPVPIRAAASGNIGGQNYIVGGGAGGVTFYTSTYIYDIASDTWCFGPPNLNARHDGGDGAAIGNRLVVVGGSNDGSDATNVVEMSIIPQPCGTPTPTATATATPVTTATPTATPAATLTPSATPTATATATFTPTPTATPTPTPACTPPCTPGPWTLDAGYPFNVEVTAVATDGTFAYSASGYDGTNARSDLLRYDPIANTWTALASMPSALFYARAAYAANVNKVYVFGGYDGNNVLATTYVYDVASNTWTTGANMPGIRVLLEAAYYPGNGKIYVIGGLDGTFTEQSQIWEYDPVADTWNTSRTAGPVSEGASNAAISGHYIYLMGGYNSNAGSTNHYRYDILSDTWTAMASLPVPNRAAASGNIGGQNYLFGGGSGTTVYTSSYIYDIASDSWCFGPDMNAPHGNTDGAAIGSRLLVVGGTDGSNNATNVVEMSIIPPPCGSPNPTPTPVTTATPTATPAATATPSPTPTASATATATATSTPTATATFTPTSTPTASSTPTATATATPRPTPTPTPPKTPHAQDATQVTATSFTANWGSVRGATGYRLDVATDSGFVHYVSGYQNLDVGNTTSRNVTGLTRDTTYYYRLRAYNAGGTSPNSNVVQLKTKHH